MSNAGSPSGSSRIAVFGGRLAMKRYTGGAPAPDSRISGSGARSARAYTVELPLIGKGAGTNSITINAPATSARSRRRRSSPTAATPIATSPARQKATSIANRLGTRRASKPGTNRYSSAYGADSRTTRPFAVIRVPNERTTADAARSDRMAAGCRNQRPAAARIAREPTSAIVTSAAAASAARPRLVTLSNGSRIDQPNTSVDSTSAIAMAVVVNHPANRASRQARMHANTASAAMVSPGKSALSGFGHARMRPPHTRRFGAAVRYEYTSAANRSTSPAARGLKSRFRSARYGNMNGTVIAATAAQATAIVATVRVFDQSCRTVSSHAMYATTAGPKKKM